MSEMNMNGEEESGKVEKAEDKPYSHFLHLADGTIVKYAVDDMDPHAALPTQVNGVAVVSVAHAEAGG